jgi:hypothetical protein
MLKRLKKLPMSIKTASLTVIFIVAFLSLPIWLPYVAGIFWVITGYNLYDWFN